MTVMEKKRGRDPLEKIWRLAGGKESLYIVGGTVRDLLLGDEVTDFDITGDIDPRKLGRDFARATKGTVVPIGERFGTTRVVNSDGIFDFTIFRGETIQEDLRDRDITFNAMAYPLGRLIREGFDAAYVIDPSSGRADLERKIVRVLSEKSITDDPVRIFRIFRFSSAYGFLIDRRSRKWASGNAPTLRRVPGERVREEIFNVFRGGSFTRILRTPDFITLVSCFAGTQIDEREARKRIRRLLSRVESPSYAPVRDVFFEELSAGRRAIDNLLLLTLFWDEGVELLHRDLFQRFRLSRKEKNFLARISGVMRRGLFPPRGASPLKPETFVDAGSFLPHLVLFADGLSAFGKRRNMVEKTIRFFIEKRNLIEKREIPWISEKSMIHHLIKRGNKPKETLRGLLSETLAGAIKNEQDMLKYIDNCSIKG